jgi:hypothetical protein
MVIFRALYFLNFFGKKKTKNSHYLSKAIAKHIILYSIGET